MTLSALYGAKWSSVCGDVFGESGATGEAWRAALNGVNPNELANGLRALGDREDTWPPGALEFAKLCKPDPVDHSQDWKANKADPRKMPSLERVAWHKANQAWIEAGNELPVPGLVEPPAPYGSPSFWEIYNAKCADVLP